MHPNFDVDGKRFTMKEYAKRTPGKFKIETVKDKTIALCSKMYCCSDMDEKNIKLSCKGMQKNDNDISYNRFYNKLFNNTVDTAHNKGFRMYNGQMHTYNQNKIGLSSIYCKRRVDNNGLTTKPLLI